MQIARSRPGALAAHSGAHGGAAESVQSMDVPRFGHAPHPWRVFSEQAGVSKPVSEDVFGSGRTTSPSPQEASHEPLADLHELVEPGPRAGTPTLKAGETPPPCSPKRAADTRLPPRPAAARSRDPNSR